MSGIIYDERMCLHERLGHPEKPDRIKAIYNKIKDSGLLSKCVPIPIREATIDELRSVHNNDYIDKISTVSDMNQSQLRKLENQYNSVYLNKYTWESALLSAGAVIELCDKVVNGAVPDGIAIVRPPGHHAECSEAMGFCIFNNVAVAARTMINKHGLKRIAIIDWDAHHGNATQHMFIDDSSVLFISIHRYDNANFYPCSTDASPFLIGNGKAAGLNVNIAWNTRRDVLVGDGDYIHAFEKIIEPMILEYNPELIIVSAGFDCAHGDPLGGLGVTQIGFNYMTRKLKKISNGKIVIALEGGYNVNVISESMLACLKGLMDIEIECPDILTVSNIAINAIDTTIHAHKLHWKFLSKNIQ